MGGGSKGDGVRPGVLSANERDADGVLARSSAGEDCLTLNIWAPADTRNAPVFFWIYGGALTSGASREAMYDGVRLAARGAVVVFDHRWAWPPSILLPGRLSILTIRHLPATIQ
jgi:acetyl esterase/lipase